MGATDKLRVILHATAGEISRHLSSCISSSGVMRPWQTTRGDVDSKLRAAAPARCSAATRNTATLRILMCDAQILQVAACHNRRA